MYLFRLDDEALDGMLQAMEREVRQQDVDAIEAVEARVEQGAAIRHEMLCRSDAPAVKVRERVQHMLAAEA